MSVTEVCREDRNVITFVTIEDFRKNIVRRARAVLGFRGHKNHENMLLNGNAIQHAERVLFHRTGGTHVTEEHMAEYAKFIASETQYWE